MSLLAVAAAAENLLKKQRWGAAAFSTKNSGAAAYRCWRKKAASLPLPKKYRR